ncbi:hypothetical protein [Microbacterium sp. BLY]|uniref:hypothetical protein n=1 Tax=Microbacterium sp. BLY TaxID=2823280 RepID=UPI001B342C62|nr:hypothetical protein [Microbacterium sp. BLY]MBP3978540.1 hypothetical protein [Microbacterium sp. BLY]
MADESEHVTAEPTVLTQAHRTIRVLDAAEEPFSGTLVTTPDGPAVRQAAEHFATWGGWRYAGAQHVAAPLDVIRRARGHDVLLPWCTRRLDVAVGRRLGSRPGLSAGEVSTVVVSLLRGLAELGPAESVAASGTWWLTEGGRPVFVLGSGKEAAVGAQEIVDRLQRECADKTLARALERIGERLRAAVGQRRVPRRLLDEGERELLEIAAPRPLETDEVETAPVAPAAGVVGALRQRDRGESVARPLRRGRRDHRQRPARGVRAWALTVATVLGDQRDRLRARAPFADDRRGTGTRRRRVRTRSRAPRARLLVLAGVCAAAVLGVGLLWPSGGEDSAVGSPQGTVTASSTPRPEERASGPGLGDAGPSPTSLPSASATPSAGDDPVPAAAALRAQVTACAEEGDVVCAGAVVPGSGGVVEIMAAAGREGDAVLVDRYGDIAVLEFPAVDGGAEGGPGTIVVLMRQAEKWLVRDAYRVADQPR